MFFTFNNRNQTSECSYCPLHTIAFFLQSEYFLGMVFAVVHDLLLMTQHIVQKQPQIRCYMMLVIF